MTLEELRRELRRRGVSLPRGTLQRYAADHLIEGPSGRGRNARWPRESVEQAAVARFLLAEKGWSAVDVQRARCLGRMCLLMGDQFEEALTNTFNSDVESHALVFSWILAIAKFRTGLPLGRARTFLVSYDRQGIKFAPRPPQKVQLPGDSKIRLVDVLRHGEISSRVHHRPVV